MKTDQAIPGAHTQDHVRTASKRKPHKRFPGWLAVLVLTICVCESVLQLASLASPQIRWSLLPPWRQQLAEEIARVTTPTNLPDPIFGYRGNPDHPRHDSRGFHNAEALTSADIVAIGDSHTYGALLGSEQAWPAQLARITSLQVYNMGFGGWGPVEYNRIMDEAIELNPKTIIIAIYMGNDVVDGYRAAYLRGVGTEFIDPSLEPAIANTQALFDLQEATTRLFRTDQKKTNATSTSNSYREKNEPTLLRRARRLVSEHCKLYSLARMIGYRFNGRHARTLAGTGDDDSDWAYAKKWAANRPNDCVIFERNGRRTIMTAAYRHLAINMVDPRIQQGMHIGLSALEEAAGKCTKVGIELIVVFLPTKEAVFSPLVTENDQIPELAELLRGEQKAKSAITAVMSRLLVPCYDLTPTLQEVVTAQTTIDQPYPPAVDGHPNPLGHRIIAQEIARLIDGQLTSDHRRTIKQTR